MPWNLSDDGAFNVLKVAITTGPVLLTADPQLPFDVYTDASGFATGAVLLQDQGRGLQPVAFQQRQAHPSREELPCA